MWIGFNWLRSGSGSRVLKRIYKNSFSKSRTSNEKLNAIIPRRPCRRALQRISLVE
jgi:hypothetical protein